MENRMSELFQSLVNENIDPINDRNVEFKLCYDLCTFKDTTPDSIAALSNDLHRMVLYLYYTRLFIHVNAYFQHYLIDGNATKEGALQYLSAFLDSTFSICKIVGYDPCNFDFYTVMNWDLNLLTSFAGVDTVDVFNMTGFLAHSLILLEDKVNWRLVQEGVNDWQGIREEIGVLFIIVAVIARLFDISYKELCSSFILARSQIK